MAEQVNDQADLLSQDDLRNWLVQEIKDATKALELRVRDASALVMAHCAGETTLIEANDAFNRHFHRWGEALPGASVSEGALDAEIVKAIDEGTGAYHSSGALGPGHVGRTKRYGGDLRGRGGDWRQLEFPVNDN
jgi:hypothetical protein